MVESQPGGASSACIDAVTLAAFVDGALDQAGRARVVAHLASCPDCTELVSEVIRTGEELQQPAVGEATDQFRKAEDRPPRKTVWSNRRGLAALGGLALAASLLTIVLNRGSALDPLVAIVGSERLTEARPTGEFRYGTMRSQLRGSSDTENLALLAEVARLRERAARTNAAADLHAAGVAQLVAGDAAASIQMLQSAVRAKPNDAAFLADLGAAYMTRFFDRGDQADAVAALETLDKALALSPSAKEARFNKALLLERLKRPAEAIAAWDSYLELPDQPGWRDEAMRRRDALPRQPTGR